MDYEKYINYPKYSKENRRNLGWLDNIYKCVIQDYFQKMSRI